MAINNYKCLECQHELVCKIKDKISVFDDDVKKPLNVDITIDSCKSFTELVDSE